MQKIYSIKVLPGSKVNKIIEQKQNYLKIKLSAPAYEGKANLSLIKFLSACFNISKNKIKIISGLKSRDKKVSLNINIDKR
ncbi:DUF167 domain-containing protein [Candidatus Falkowbacteria bacterium]|nr:DUF167 domain-containing protein [Candidatus Falkowbacteria bacterium]